MAGRSWLVDGNRFATKIRCAAGTCDLGKVEWKSNPTRLCPGCNHIIDNSDSNLPFRAVYVSSWPHELLGDVAVSGVDNVLLLMSMDSRTSRHSQVIQEWPGLPRGVKFDPTDQEIIQHLLAKSDAGNEKPHPFIGEFIPTVEEDDGICYTHPCNLPGVKQDGTASHFFHKAIQAYNTGTRKRRKIGDTVSDVRWHKTGRTKPVFVNGVQKGCKKIMVLYVSESKGAKAEKTNWVMHQYHLGTEEDEKNGEFIISKVFLQQQPLKPSGKVAVGSPTDDNIVVKADPVTPKSVAPEKRVNPTEDDLLTFIDFGPQDHNMRFADEMRQPEVSKSSDDDNSAWETSSNQALDHDDTALEPVTNQTSDHDNIEAGNEGNIWWEGESQEVLNSQQLMEGLSMCDDFLQSQSPTRDGTVNDMPKRSVLSDYANPEDLKKDLEDCQNLDAANINLDTPPDVRLSQLDFGSQDSYLAWGGL